MPALTTEEQREHLGKHPQLARHFENALKKRGERYMKAVDAFVAEVNASEAAFDAEWLEMYNAWKISHPEAFDIHDRKYAFNWKNDSFTAFTVDGEQRGGIYTLMTGAFQAVDKYRQFPYPLFSTYEDAQLWLIDQVR